MIDKSSAFFTTGTIRPRSVSTASAKCTFLNRRTESPRKWLFTLGNCCRALITAKHTKSLSVILVAKRPSSIAFLAFLRSSIMRRASALRWWVSCAEFCNDACIALAIILRMLEIGLTSLSAPAVAMLATAISAPRAAPARPVPYFGATAPVSSAIAFASGVILAVE